MSHNSSIYAAKCRIAEFLNRSSFILHQDSRNRRRHAWDFPTVKTDGFKLGNLLERKRGFEKLDQEASDEEPSSSTNALLSSAQFA